MTEPSLNAETQTVFLADEQATTDYGKALSKLLKAPSIIHIVGDLGAGKTTLVRGILRGLGVIGKVRSPSYSLVENYDIRQDLNILHLDLYRLPRDSGGESYLDDLGFRDYLNDATICLIEWPLEGSHYDIKITLSDGEDEGRWLTLTQRLTH